MAGALAWAVAGVGWKTPWHTGAGPDLRFIGWLASALTLGGKGGRLAGALAWAVVGVGRETPWHTGAGPDLRTVGWLASVLSLFGGGARSLKESAKILINQEGGGTPSFPD